MRRIRVTLSYDGTDYYGWQVQPGLPTIQGVIESVLAQIESAEVKVEGSGRTDAGVHALGQVAHLKLRTPTRFAPEQILRELNNRLPSSIAVVELVPAPPRFHARHDAVSRAYFYQISTRKTALAKRYVWWVKEPLDTEPMRKAAALLAGRHDFGAFRAPDPSKPGESTIVVVDSAEIGLDEHLIVFRVEASHFLWKMVRRLAGTLVKIGKGEITVEQFRSLLSGTSQTVLDIAAWTAPASGLFLESIKYPEKLENKPKHRAEAPKSRKREAPLRASNSLGTQ